MILTRGTVLNSRITWQEYDVIVHMSNLVGMNSRKYCPGSCKPRQFPGSWLGTTITQAINSQETFNLNLHLIFSIQINKLDFAKS